MHSDRVRRRLAIRVQARRTLGLVRAPIAIMPALRIDALAHDAQPVNALFLAAAIGDGRVRVPVARKYGSIAKPALGRLLVGHELGAREP